MSDEPIEISASDRHQIDVNQSHDVQYWCQRYEVSEFDLRKAIADVGPGADQVAVHLGCR